MARVDACLRVLIVTVWKMWPLRCSASVCRRWFATLLSKLLHCSWRTGLAVLPVPHTEKCIFCEKCVLLTTQWVRHEDAPRTAKSQTNWGIAFSSLFLNAFPTDIDVLLSECSIQSTLSSSLLWLSLPPVAKNCSENYGQDHQFLPNFCHHMVRGKCTLSGGLGCVRARMWQQSAALVTLHPSKALLWCACHVLLQLVVGNDSLSLSLVASLVIVISTDDGGDHCH